MGTESSILLVSDDKQISEQIMQQALQMYPNLQQAAPSEVKKEIDRLSPDVVLLVNPDDESGIELVQYIHSEYPNIIIVFIAKQQDFLLLRDASRAGSTDFFILPDELSQFSDRIERILLIAKEQNAKNENSLIAPQGGLRRGRGQIFSFYSGKGGSGSTLLSSTFAQTLKLESTAQVLFIDMNLQFGGADMYLGIESNRSLADLRPVINELNENHIRNVSEKEPFSKMEILLSPRDAEIAESLNEDFFTKLLRACRRSYDFVIVDLPSTMSANTYVALEEADQIYYVMNLDTPSFQVFKHVEDLFKRLGMDTEGRLQIVVNQKGRENELTPSDVKNFITSPVGAEVRRDIKGVQTFINKGEPLRKATKEKKLIPMAKDIRKWVLSILK
ncbi:pilus assembly protein CpaE [Cytobacillus eiseniae]|uniref:Pilus assembly protein CpaE n=1 Tax=Cytobacillus eiseniae TaxID=762947 RepID=A0ABS4RFU0_9BACI|nr:AAA family ATPase [Cytobacillus eiseniae]MBP2241764.1 pilus assembly protein CpaE [Cytobacillus eiseniae]